jgi:PEP-CTERM motif
MKLFALAAAALLGTPAFAGAVNIDFEGVTSFASIGATYAARGVNFGPDAQGLVNDAAGPYFSNAPSPVGVMFLSGLNVPDATMNVAAGFEALTFYYSSADAVSNAVQVWSGAGGTGTLIASYNLLANATQGCTDTAYCHWDLLGGRLSQTALSVTFGAGTQAAAFDNISAVPEPASALLVGLGLTALAIKRRRR